MPEPQPVVVASDHAGYRLKVELVKALEKAGHQVEDLGTHDESSTDYPDFAHQLCEAVTSGRFTRGLLVCGTGLGMSMAANRHPGIRAAVCTDSYAARMTRAHNDANVLCLGSRIVGPGVAEDILEAFLESEFEGGRHARRVDKIEPA